MTEKEFDKIMDSNKDYYFNYEKALELNLIIEGKSLSEIITN